MNKINVNPGGKQRAMARQVKEGGFRGGLQIVVVSRSKVGPSAKTFKLPEDLSVIDPDA